MTLSTPVKIVALAGLALMLGLGGVLMLVAHGSSGSTKVVVPPAAVHRAVVQAKPKVVAVHRRVVAFHVTPGTPLIVERVLRHHPSAVVVVYSSRNASDRAFLTAARTGARMAHAGFVAADVAREPIAAAVAAWSPGVAVPAFLVVRRPGTILFTDGGTTDAQTVAQAASSAR